MPRDKIIYFMINKHRNKTYKEIKKANDSWAETRYAERKLY